MFKKKKRDKSNLTSNLIRRPIQKWAPLFILPVFVCFCIGFVWPFIHGIYLSFCNFNIPKDAQWVGIENYAKAFKDPGFTRAFWNTAGFAIVTIIVINVFAFAVAYALTQKMECQDAIDFAVAASCLKHTMEGDYNRTTVADVKNLLKSGGNGRVQR